MANEKQTSTPQQPADAAADRLNPTDVELQALKSKFGEVFRMRIGDKAIIVRQFNEAEWDRFQSGAEKGNPRSLKDLLASCVVWSSEPFESIIAKRPAFGKKFGMGLVEWAGRGDELEKNEL